MPGYHVTLHGDTTGVNAEAHLGSMAELTPTRAPRADLSHAAVLSPHPWGVHEARFSRADDRLQALLAPGAVRGSPAPGAAGTPVRGSRAPPQQEDRLATTAALNSAEFLRSPLADRNRAIDPQVAGLLNNQHPASPRLLESSRDSLKPYPGLSKPADLSATAWSTPPSRSPRTPMWEEPVVTTSSASGRPPVPTARQRLTSPALSAGTAGVAGQPIGQRAATTRSMSKPEQEVSRLLYGAASIAPTSSQRPPPSSPLPTAAPTSSSYKGHGYQEALKGAVAAEPDAHWARVSSYNQRYWSKLGSYRALWLRQNTPGLAATLSTAPQPAVRSTPVGLGRSTLGFGEQTPAPAWGHLVGVPAANTHVGVRNLLWSCNPCGSFSGAGVRALPTRSVQETLLTRDQARVLAVEMGIAAPGERFDRLFDQMAVSGESQRRPPAGALPLPFAVLPQSQSLGAPFLCPFRRNGSLVAIAGGGMIDAMSCARLVQFMQSSVIGAVGQWRRCYSAGTHTQTHALMSNAFSCS